MFKSIQGCRAVAALLVVLHHLGGALASPKYFGVAAFALPFVAGDAGVEFFFVLSGFVITWAHFGDVGRPASLIHYLRKRITRIYPVYWCVFAALYLGAMLVPSARASVPRDLPTLAWSLALLPQAPSLLSPNGAPVVTVAWSLQYEMCFYAVFAACIANRLLGFMMVAVLAANFAECHSGSCSFARQFLADNLVILFGIGTLVAVVARLGLRIRAPRAVAVAGATVFIAFGTYEALFGTESLPIDRRLIYGLASAALILALVQLERRGGPPRTRGGWLWLIGDASYLLYLIHFGLISVLCQLLIHAGLSGLAGASIAFAVILPTCVAIAVALHLKIERPMLRWLAARGGESATGHPRSHSANDG